MQSLLQSIDGRLQELEETKYWLELLLGIVAEQHLSELMQEPKELTAILLRMKAKIRICHYPFEAPSLLKK